MHGDHQQYGRAVREMWIGQKDRRARISSNSHHAGVRRDDKGLHSKCRARLSDDENMRR